MCMCSTHQPDAVQGLMTKMWKHISEQTSDHFMTRMYCAQGSPSDSYFLLTQTTRKNETQQNSKQSSAYTWVGSLVNQSKYTLKQIWWQQLTVNYPEIQTRYCTSYLGRGDWKNRAKKLRGFSYHFTFELTLMVYCEENKCSIFNLTFRTC
jgi:hypothetical protein